jgi:hypothetical protein
VSKPHVFSISIAIPMMGIIPTYHFGNLLEHTSLRHGVGELRQLQESGGLDHDAPALNKPFAFDSP